MNLPIPTAAQARQTIAQGQYDKAQKQADEISKLINNAITEGKASVSYGSLEDSVRSQLEAKGYKISSGQQYNETWTSISIPWGR